MGGAAAPRHATPSCSSSPAGPASGERDAARRGARSAALIELVRGIRNARAEAKLEPRDWLAGRRRTCRSRARADASRRSARPSSGWPGRARSSAELTREALAATAGRGRPRGHRRRARGARPRRGSRPTPPRDAALDRARLERELAEAEGWLAAARERLANDAFVSRAPAAVVEGARAREAELADQVDRLRDRLGR